EKHHEKHSTEPSKTEHKLMNGVRWGLNNARYLLSGYKLSSLTKQNGNENVHFSGFNGQAVSLTKLMKEKNQQLPQMISIVGKWYNSEWSDIDRDLKTQNKATNRILNIIDPKNTGEDVLVKFDNKGKLVSTLGLVDRDDPAFDKTGKNGSDEFGKGWLYSGFTPQMERKKGYYKQLVTANILEAKNRGEEKMYLYTEDHNVAMYERFGFGNQGHRTDNGVTENVMILDLTKFSQDDIKKFPLSAKPNSNEVDEATKSKDV
ncbi:MAG: hypothetical protein RLZZ210_1251, partial [Pseudomonadota bacterium]